MKTGKQAAAFSQRVNCFIKMILPPSVRLSLWGGIKVYSLRYKCIRLSKAKNSLSLVCSVFVCSLIHLFRRCLLSSCLERNCLENCERKVELRADNQHFCSIKRMASVEYIKTALKALGGLRIAC